MDELRLNKYIYIYTHNIYRYISIVLSVSIDIHISNTQVDLDIFHQHFGKIPTKICFLQNVFFAQKPWSSF